MLDVFADDHWCLWVLIENKIKVHMPMLIRCLL